MKKMLLAFLAFNLSIASQAQLTTLWEKTAGNSYTWFTTATNNTTGCAYNPATNKLLLADRNNLIAIINVTTGNSEGTLVTTGVGTEAFKWNKIRVTTDGVIYGISLATAAGSCKIYRWENQLATPTLCATFTVGERCGDAFGLSGTGTNTLLYASGSAINGTAINIYVLNTTNGTDFNLANTINVPVTGTIPWAGRTVDPVTTGAASDIWIRSSSTSARRITSAGAVAFTSTDGTAANQAATNFANARYFQTSNNKKYLAFTAATTAPNGLALKLLNVTDESNFIDGGSATLTNTFNANANASGDIAFKNNGDGTYTIFYVVTNNGVMAVQTNNLLPVTLSSFTGEVTNGKAKLNFTTATETNNKGFELERSVDGANFSSICFVASKAIDGNASTTNTYSIVDAKMNGGANYYRLKQIDKDNKHTYSKTIVLQNEKSNFSASLLANPIKDVLQLNVYSQEAKSILVNIYNQAGVLLYTKQQVVNKGNSLLTIDATSFTKGVLLVQVNTGINTQPITLKAIK
jgi:hypothetical protein